MPRHLTAKQRDFAHFVADGYTLADAYRRTFNPQSSPSTVHKEASRMRKNPQVAAFIRELQSKVDKVNLADREEKRRELALLIRDKKLKPLDRIRAIETDNRMAGHNEPEPVAHWGLSELLQSVRKARSVLL